MAHHSGSGVESLAAACPDRAEWLESVLVSLGVGVIALQPSGTIRYVNDAAVRLLDGLSIEPEELVARIAPGSSQEIARTTADGARTTCVVERRGLSSAHDGEVMILKSPSETSRDAGTADRLQRLEQALRVLSVISHEINNPLTALLGRSQLLRTRVTGDALVEKSAQVVDESASRLAELARELSRVLKESREESVDEILAAERGGHDPTQRPLR